MESFNPGARNVGNYREGRPCFQYGIGWDARFPAIPAKARIQLNQEVMGPRLRGSDGFSDFLRGHQRKA